MLYCCFSDMVFYYKMRRLLQIATVHSMTPFHVHAPIYFHTRKDRKTGKIVTKRFHLYALICSDSLMILRFSIHTLIYSYNYL